MDHEFNDKATVGEGGGAGKEISLCISIVVIVSTKIARS